MKTVHARVHARVLMCVSSLGQIGWEASLGRQRPRSSCLRQGMSPSTISWHSHVHCTSVGLHKSGPPIGGWGTWQGMHPLLICIYMHCSSHRHDICQTFYTQNNLFYTICELLSGAQLSGVQLTVCINTALLHLMICVHKLNIDSLIGCVHFEQVLEGV